MSETEDLCTKFETNGWSVHYDKFGSGPKPLLMIPGAIGTAKSDYWPQLCGDDALDEEIFTIIVVEAPGWGRSTPPARKYGSKVYANDSEGFYKLMKHLGYDHFSIIGWSDGAKTAIDMSIKYPETVVGLLVMGVFIRSTQTAIKFLKTTVDIHCWGQQKIDLYLRSYETHEQIQDLWTKYVRSVEFLDQYFTNDMFKDKYHLIKCPVLIIFGEKDQISDIQQCEHLRKNIRRSQLFTFPSAGHDFHLRFPTKFKELTEKLLSKC